MSKYTLHNKTGDFMGETTKSLPKAKKLCDACKFDCIVMEEYFTPSPFLTNPPKITAHGRPVYQNF